jgi:hypothetical protein
VLLRSLHSLFLSCYGLTALSVDDAYEFSTLSASPTGQDGACSFSGRSRYCGSGYHWLCVSLCWLVGIHNGLVLVEGVDFALHCMAWMVYPDLALSVWCDGAVLGIVAAGERGG